ncbi:hypothetical protein Hanom_Chr05g00416451 [Helianthus anomalus]
MAPKRRNTRKQPNYQLPTTEAELEALSSHSMKQTVLIPAAVLEAPEVLDLEDQERVATL